MSTVDRTPAVEDPTAALEIAPTGSDRRSGAAVGDLPPGRYLMLGDEAAGSAIALGAVVTHIGRGITADIRFDDHTVSARHAIIVARASGLRILDDRSRNGTLVNGTRVDEAQLHDGDVVVLGRVVLTYRDLRAAA